MVNKKIVGIGVVAVVAVAAIMVVTILPQGTDTVPVIGNPIAPGSPYAGQNIPISVMVVDDKGVSTGILSWSNDSGSSWHNITMSGSGTTTWFGTGNIPAQDIEATVQYKIYAQDTAGQWNEKDGAHSLYTGSRKAIIVNGEDRFFGSSNENFNSGSDSDFPSGFGNWEFENGTNGFALWSILGNQVAGSLNILPTISDLPVKTNFTLNWNLHYPPLIEYAYYNISAWVCIGGTLTPTGVNTGVKVGLRWNDTNGETRVDFTPGIFTTGGVGQWVQIGCSGVCNNQTGAKIDHLELILSVDAVMGGTMPNVYFDDVKIEHWISVNATTSNPTSGNPPPTGADAFPAQSLQVYKILKYHGYTDANIFLMLYNVNNPVVDITAGDGMANDVEGAVVDVANASITANRFKQELNVSESGHFGAGIQRNDQLIIFMVDHGSNKWIGDGNASFHFATGGQITEFEFYDLVSNITCWRMLINVDCCFSGNFLQNCSIGPTWYDLPNAILASAANNVASWYWKNNDNGNGFAGSWMFHPFWDSLNASQTIDTAFNAALNFIPTMPPPSNNVAAIQTPLLQDNLGIKTTWSFSSFPKL